MSFDRCRYQRLYARAKRKGEWRARAAGRRTCPHKSGNHVCGGLLERAVDRHGAIHDWCRLCARREAGICRDCPAPVDGQPRRAIRCGRCKAAAQRRAMARYRDRNRSLLNRRARLAARRQREARAAYKRLWRLANPDKVRAQKRRAAIRNAGTHAARSADWRVKHPGYILRVERRCVACPRPVLGRQKKCDTCKTNHRIQAQGQLAPRRGRGRQTDRECAA